MDILSLATLSFDKRRSEFFTKELIIILKLIDNGTINKNILIFMGRCFSNFQFMPFTIDNYAIQVVKINYKVNRNYLQLLII